MAGQLNPYEPPQHASTPTFRESATELVDLERRIQELERQLSRSWFVAPNVVKRIFAVWGHLLIGYFVGAMIVVPLVMFLEWLGVRI